ncbi:MAG: PTS sugar transporter subunit IIA [candidate division WOR-3 bacterium]|nr:PTS sugar transporter subunit IIA [candidate division WOR-3 bacterium]
MEIFTIEEVARFLKVSKEKVLELIERGEMPAIEIGDSYRITNKVLNEFIGDTTDEKDYNILEPSFYILNGGLVDDIDVNSKEDLIDRIVKVAILYNDLSDENEKEFRNHLLDRESMSSTGVGHGIAILHTKEVYKDLRKPFIIFARLSEPVDFESIDGQDVDLVFLIAMPDRHSHLKIMGALSKMIHKQDQFINELRASPREELLDIIIKQENKVLVNGL